MALALKTDYTFHLRFAMVERMRAARETVGSGILPRERPM